ncbi:hypothetical protein GCM10009802_31620 [Streptomyces synnematoformans]|uniref:ATP-binding protein n=1 Tax=Streptomyces synnematoformans TaxID=415721 RepID=A0ABN2YH13_9ACTN
MPGSGCVRTHGEREYLNVDVDQGPRRPVRIVERIAQRDAGKAPRGDGASGTEETAEDVADRGRGLLIVDKLAEKWGANPLRGGTLAWARLTIPAAAAGFWER